MAKKPKGHKPGCKCVACSPATRARGQRALEASRKKGAKAAATPKAPQARAAADEPARPNGGGAKKKKRRAARPAAQGQAQAPKAETVERFVSVPAEVFEGKTGYLVLHGKTGRRVESAKFLRTQKEVREFAASVKTGWAGAFQPVLVGKA